MSEDLFSISLTVRHSEYTADEIASSFGMAPNIKNTVGDSRKTPKGTALPGKYRETYCSFHLIDKEEGYFIDGLKTIVSSLTHLAKRFIDINKSGGTVLLYVGVFTDGSCGMVIDADLMRELSSMGIQLGIEVYR